MAEGKIRVADAGVGVAVAAGDEQIGVSVQRAPGKGVQQGGFAPAGPAGDERDARLPRKRCLQKPLQTGQLPFAGDKDGSLDVGW